jgi:hypothetical protein
MKPQHPFLQLLSYLEVGYLVILPFMGYIATGLLNEQYTMLPIIGIGLLFLYQTLAVGLWEYQKNSNDKRTHLFILLPIALTLFNYIYLAENFLIFWVEKAVFELGAFSAAFLLIIFTGKNEQGRSAKEDLGIGIPLIVAAILIASLWEMASAWYLHNPYFKDGNQFWLSSLALSCILDSVWTYLLLKKLLHGEIVISDVFSSKYGMTLIFVQLGLWIIVIPAVLALMGKLH